MYQMVFSSLYSAMFCIFFDEINILPVNGKFLIQTGLTWFQPSPGRPDLVMIKFYSQLKMKIKLKVEHASSKRADPVLAISPNTIVSTKKDQVVSKTQWVSILNQQLKRLNHQMYWYFDKHNWNYDKDYLKR